MCVSERLWVACACPCRTIEGRFITIFYWKIFVFFILKAFYAIQWITTKCIKHLQEFKIWNETIDGRAKWKWKRRKIFLKKNRNEKRKNERKKYKLISMEKVQLIGNEWLCNFMHAIWMCTTRHAFKSFSFSFAFSFYSFNSKWIKCFHCRK